MTEDQKFFDASRDMFLGDGWNFFMSEVELKLESTTLDHCNSTEDFWLAKGRLQALREIYIYEDQVKEAEESYDAKDL